MIKSIHMQKPMTEPVFEYVKCPVLYEVEHCETEEPIEDEQEEMVINVDVVSDLQ